MDPNTILAQIRALLVQVDKAETLAEANYLREEALDSFQTLDEWMSHGGFKPEQWGG
jgi:hypothetical protein